MRKQIIRRKRALVITTSHQKLSKEKTFLKVISVFASNGKTCVQTLDLLGSGSYATLILEILASKLQLRRITKEIALTSVLSMTNKVPSELLWSHPEKLLIINLQVVHDLKVSVCSERNSSAKESFDYLNDIPSDPAKSENIELLVGPDHPNLYLYTETRLRNYNKPYALYTTLAWVLSWGNKKSENCILHKVTLESATDIIQKSWDIKWYSAVPKDDISVMTVEDKKSVEFFKEITFKSHYITDLFWKESNSILPNN